MSLKRIAAAIESDLPSSEKLVLILLANNARDEDGTCFPSQGYLARKSGFARGTVNGIIKKLEKAGFIRITRQYRDDGGLRANIYTVFPYDPCNPGLQGVVIQDDRGMSSRVTAITTHKEPPINNPGVRYAKGRRPSAAERARIAEIRVAQADSE